MQQSDLSRLQTFIDNLGQDKVLSDSWDERYIDDIYAMQGYNEAKSLARMKKRYVNIDETLNDGYSIQSYKSSCDVPVGPNECDVCCDYKEETHQCIYNEMKCNRFFANAVHNWSELCGYHILFLQGKTPGTPGHPGPWNKETSYIIDPLTRILKYGILTADSEPGLMIYDDKIGDYIQKPYLTIKGPAGRIHRILVKILYPQEPITLDNSIIKYVPHPMRRVDFDGYNNYNKDNQDYVSVMLGIDNPSFLSSDYTDYILSNRFFDHIANIVENTA